MKEHPEEDKVIEWVEYDIETGESGKSQSKINWKFVSILTNFLL